MRPYLTGVLVGMLSLSLFSSVVLLFELQQERVNHLRTKTEYSEFVDFVGDHLRKQRELREAKEKLEAEARQRSSCP